MGKWKILSSLENWEYTVREIEHELAENGFSQSFKTSFMLSADEVYANISMYAYPFGEGNVIIETEYESDEKERKVYIFFRDEGKPFNPLERAFSQNLEERDASKREVGGLGIFLTKKHTDEIKYEYTDGFNKLTLMKKEAI